jgi:hypothetical protein
MKKKVGQPELNHYVKKHGISSFFEQLVVIKITWNYLSEEKNS